MADVLDLQDIRKSYPSGAGEIDVLHGIDLRLQRGEFAALIGPSGSGKSTLLNLIGLLDRPSAGRLCIDGDETSTLPEAAITRLRGQRIGFVFQHHLLISAFTALENVMMPLLIRRLPRSEAEQAAVALLEKVGLGKRMQHKPGELSGGERQRAAIARALVTRPACLLADEPTGNLDSHNAQAVFDLMLDLNDQLGTSLVIVTHDMGLAARAGRIVRLAEGRLVAE